MFKKKGFTLIELLVVVSIIGLLSSVVLTSLNEARAKARDAVRISDLQQIQKALQLYYEDNNETYPIYSNDFGILSTNNLSWNNLASELSVYISPIPKDSINDRTSWFSWGGGNYAYFYKSDVGGNTYDLIAWLETNNSLRCSLNNWVFNTDLVTWSTPNGGWCTSTNWPYGWIDLKNSIYDVTR